VGEKWWSAISLADQRLQRWLASIAPQLHPQQTFERYLCWLNLKPAMETADYADERGYQEITEYP
jgi:hypothetical protein